MGKDTSFFCHRIFDILVWILVCLISFGTPFLEPSTSGTRISRRLSAFRMVKENNRIQSCSKTYFLLTRKD